MKEITLETFKKLPKKGPISRNSLKPGTMYYIHDTRRNDNPVYIGTYVKPVYYYNDNNSTSVNYRFENVSYLVKPSKYKNEPGTIFGNVVNYFEVLYIEPTSVDIKNKKKTIKELTTFINEKKLEPHDTPPTISFMGKDYRKARDKFYNRTRSSSSTKRSRHTTPTITSSSRKRSKKTSSSRSSSSRMPSYSSSSRGSSSFRRRTRRTSRR
jgi:hypothetical protein